MYLISRYTGVFHEPSDDPMGPFGVFARCGAGASRRAFQGHHAAHGGEDAAATRGIVDFTIRS